MTARVWAAGGEPYEAFYRLLEACQHDRQRLRHARRESFVCSGCNGDLGTVWRTDIGDLLVVTQAAGWFERLAAGAEAPDPDDVHLQHRAAHRVHVVAHLTDHEVDLQCRCRRRVLPGSRLLALLQPSEPTRRLRRIPLVC